MLVRAFMELGWKYPPIVTNDGKDIVAVCPGTEVKYPPIVVNAGKEKLVTAENPLSWKYPPTVVRDGKEML